MYNDGPYTPYGAKGATVVFSGTIGGGNWGGVAFNPPLGYVFVNTSNLATLGRMVPDPQNPGQFRNELAYTRFWDDNKYPCQQPPWGELVAVNANTGDIAWKIPLGVYPELVAKGIPPTGTPNLGGPIATASGLVFIGATKDARFRAFDAKTGKELWYAQLEAAGAATPMTFMGRDGTQYVVIAAGGPGDTDRGGTEQYPQKLVGVRAVGIAGEGGAGRHGGSRGRAGGVLRGARGDDALARAHGAGARRPDRAHLHELPRPRPIDHRRPHAGRVEEGRSRRWWRWAPRERPTTCGWWLNTSRRRIPPDGRPVTMTGSCRDATHCTLLGGGGAGRRVALQGIRAGGDLRLGVRSASSRGTCNGPTSRAPSPWPRRPASTPSNGTSARADTSRRSGWSRSCPAPSS